MVCNSKSKGFTLLEVLIAIALLALAMVVLLEAQGVSTVSTIYSRDLTVATQLARARMAKLEQEIEDKRIRFGLSKSSCEKGDFNDVSTKFSKFSWEYCIKKIQVAIPTQIPGLGGGDGADGKDGKVQAGQSLMAALGVPMPSGGDISSIASSLGPFMGLIQQQMKTIFEQLQESLRELEVTVRWKDGKREEEFSLVTHLFHFNEASGMPDGWPIPKDDSAGGN